MGNLTRGESTNNPRIDRGRSDLSKYAELIGDKYTQKILAATFIRPKGVQQICVLFDIPVAQAYRRVHTLASLGLLECVDKKLNQRGKWVKLYKSCVRNISVCYERGKMKVKLDLTSLSETVDGTWDVLSAE